MYAVFAIDTLRMQSLFGPAVAHERGYDCTVPLRFGREVARVADAKANARIVKLLPRELQIALRRINAVDLRRVGVAKYGFSERTRAAADVQPPCSRRDREPFDKLASDETAPPTYVRFVRCATRPHAW